MQIAKARKRLGAVLLAVCLLVALAFGGVSAYAAVAGTGNNTLTVNATNNPEDDIAKAGVTVNVYKIATATKDSSYDTYNFTFDVAPFTSLASSYTKDTMTGAKWQDLANQAATMTEGATAATTSPVPVGEAITGLEDGLYLVVAADAHTEMFEYSFNPTIISLPTKEPLKDSSGNPILDENGFPIIATSQEYGDWITTGNITLKSEQKPLYGSLRITKTVQDFSGERATFTYHIESTADSPHEYANDISVQVTESGTFEAFDTHILAGTVVTVSEIHEGTRYEFVSGDSTPKTIIADVLVGEQPDRYSNPTAAFENKSGGNPNQGHGDENRFELVKTGDGATDWDWQWTKIQSSEKSD